MSQNMNEKRRLLESIEYIDDAMISDTLSRVKTDVGKPSAVKRSIMWVKQVAVVAACALLLGAVIPVVNYVSNNPSFGGIGAGNAPAETTEPKIETTATVEETEPIPEETEFVPDEHGTPGLLYVINEDGMSASFIGWGDCQDETVYIASVYEGLPVTQMLFIERIEQIEQIEGDYAAHANDPNYRSMEESYSAKHFENPYIKHIVISDTVEFLWGELINMCSNLETVHFGASLSDMQGTIHFNGDWGRSFSSITVSPENQYYTVKGNCLIRIADKVLMLGFADSVIPDDGSVEVIGNVAFFNRPGVTSVVVPEGVTKIMNLAFGELEELQSISLPSSVKTLFLPFADNPALTEFTYAGTVKQWKSLAARSLRWIRDTALTQVICSDGVVELKFDSRGDVID